MKRKHLLLFVAVSLFAGFNVSSAQPSLGQHVIMPAVPFLRLAPDARSGGMGDAGVATSPDANSIHFNAAKLAFIETKFGASVSYMPYLRKLVNDRFLANISAYFKINTKHVVATNVTYFDLGDYFDISSMEYFIGGAYAGKVSDKLSVGVGLKYIYSDLNAYSSPGFTFKPGQTVAGDVSVYYRNRMYILGEEIDFAFGAGITNIGGSITYTDKNSRQYIPTTLKFGPAFTYPVNEDNKITLTADVNKLLVPTISQVVPINRPAFNGMISSFTDAPGGFSEEMKEFYYASGAEYSFKNIVLLRGGYYSEHRDKSNQKYFTLGAGVRYKLATFNISYLIAQERVNPIDDTMRFTLLINTGQVN